MADRPVVDASPLIFLTRADLLDLLRLVSSEVVVPAPVADEIRRRGPTDPAARALAAVPWLSIRNAPTIDPSIQAWDLGPGESSVLSWCLEHPGTEAILDDLAARRCAQSLGIPVRGTLGLVLLGKRQGHLPAARPVLEALRHAGMYLSDAVLDRALRMVDE